MGNSKTRSKLDAKSDRARAGSLSADSDQWNWRPPTVMHDLLLGRPTPNISPEVLGKLEKEFQLEREQLELMLRYVVAKYLFYLQFYKAPTPTFFNEQASRVSQVSHALLDVIKDLPPFFVSMLDDELRRSAGMRLMQVTRGKKQVSLEEALSVLIEYCRSFRALLHPGARRKDYIVHAAADLIELWESLSDKYFERNYRTGKGISGSEFIASGPRFVQLILQDLDKQLTTTEDKKLTTKKIEGAIRAAFRKGAGAKYPTFEGGIF